MSHDDVNLAAGQPGLPTVEPETDPLVGQMAGSFRIQELLGVGGMGAVYLAEHPVIGNRVAIKFLHDQLAQNPDTVFRFYQEARAAHVVGHENIVSIYDLNRLPPRRYYMVMEYLDGETLADRLMARGVLDVGETLGILLQLCDALHAAHEAGVVHRDLKPDNVFLVERRGQKDFVKLVDFGIAKLRDTGRTATGLIVGTPDYMAPEQCGAGVVDARTDIYALGVIAYRMVTGRLPFFGETVPQVLYAQVHEEPVPPRRLDPRVSPMLDRAILRALQKRPEERFQTMRGFRDALLAVRDMMRGKTPTPARLSTSPGSLLVDLHEAGKAPRKLSAMHLTESAVFLCDPNPPPALFTRVTVLVPQPGGAQQLAGEVVRHVSADEARRFGGAPGFAVQFLRLDDAKRLFDDDDEDSQGGRLLAKYNGAKTHYELLGLEWNVELPDVQSRGRWVRKELELLSERPLTVKQKQELSALLSRVDDAVATLTHLDRRVQYDASLGNFLGVARCIDAGYPMVRLGERHFQFRKAHPETDAQVEEHRARIRLAHALGNDDAAIGECEQALRLQPLDRELHALRVKLRRRDRRS